MVNLEFLNNISQSDLEKLKMLFSMMSSSKITEVVTLRVFTDEYSDFISNNRSKNYSISVRISFQHLNEHFGIQTPISSINLKACESFVASLRNKVGEGYRVYYRTLKAAFNKALEWKYIDENNFLKVKLPKKQKLAPPFIDENQLKNISEKIKVNSVKHIVVLGFHTGMRLNELVSLRWRNVNSTDRIITVGDHDFVTKGRQQRFIPISDEAFEILRSRKEEIKAAAVNNDEFVFTRLNGKRFTGDYISKSFKAACREAEIDERIHFHSLRHSFASLLAQRGVSLYIIKELLGHSSISTTEIYSHLNKESLRTAIKLLDKKD